MPQKRVVLNRSACLSYTPLLLNLPRLPCGNAGHFVIFTLLTATSNSNCLRPTAKCAKSPDEADRGSLWERGVDPN